MRSALAFLALFGAVVALIVWFDEPPVGRPAEETAGPDPGVRPDEPAGMHLSGAFRATGYTPTDGDTKKRLWVIESEDSHTIDGRDELLRVTAFLFEPASGDLQAELRAARGIVQRVGERTEFHTPVFEPRIRLFEVDGDLVAGAPVVPLHFVSSELDVDLAARTLTTDSAVTVDGRGLDANGTGLSALLDAGGAAGELRFVRDATASIAREGDDSAELRSAGPLRIASDPVRSADGGGDAFLVEAERDASLVVPGDAPSRIEAERIVLTGRSPTGDAELPRLESLRAEGDVVQRSRRATLYGERLRLDFGADGNPSAGALEGEPRGRIRLRELEGPLSEVLGVGEDEAPVLDLVRAARLDVRWLVDGLRVDVGGPSVLAADQAVLRTAGNVVVTQSDEGERATLVARRNVVLETPEGRLETESLDASVVADGELHRLDATSQGPATLTGELRDGRAFTLLTSDELVLARRGDVLTVPRAGGIDLTVDSSAERPGFRAQAGRVRSFDPGGPSLRADGGVEIGGDDGVGSGQEFELLGPDRFRLTATTPEGRARWSGSGLTASARSIERDGDVVIARFDVEANYRAGRDTYDVRAETLRLDRNETTDDPLHARVRRTNVDARGGVTTEIDNADGHSLIRAESMLATRVDRFATLEAREPVSSDSTVVARGGAEGDLQFAEMRLSLSSEDLVLERRDAVDELPEGSIRALGGVSFEGEAGIEFAGTGREFESDLYGHGFLAAGPDERVTALGLLPSHRLPFELEADRVDFEPERLAASRVSITVAQLALPEGRPAREGRGDVTASAERGVLSRDGLELQGSVHAAGTTARGEPFTLDTARLIFVGSAPGIDAVGAGTELRAIDATGGIELRLGELLHATGGRLYGQALLGALRLEADDDSLARIVGGPFEFESSWIELDPELRMVMGSGAGSVTPTAAVSPPWRLEHGGAHTVLEPDSLVLVLQEPSFRRSIAWALLGETRELTIQGTWAAFWLSRAGWVDLPARLASEPSEPEDLRTVALDDAAGPRRPRLHEVLRASLGGVLRETYLEGPVEAYLDARLIARLDAAYLDVITGHGWLGGADLNVPGAALGMSFENMRVLAEWLRYSADGSLRSRDATITPCDHDDPHVRIVTGDLRLQPVQTEEGTEYEFALTDNRVELYDRLTLPLPPIGGSTDKEGNPLWETLRVGDSGRFGSFVEAGIRRPAGRVGEQINGILGGNPFDYDASYSVKGSLLGSRGGLLDLGLQVESKGSYWLEMYLGAVYDTGKDRGYIRVDERDRDELRLWYRARGRFPLAERAWIEVGVSSQSDAGVQSEFFERDYVNYEQDETFVRWRKADDGAYYDATVLARVDDFRSQIEQLPSLGAYRGRSELFQFGPWSGLYEGSARAEYLRRREGESEPTFQPGSLTPAPTAKWQSPFGLPNVYADGLGEREVLRVDTAHTLEVPIPLGFGGLRATPFVGLHATTWSDDTTRTDSPARAVAEAGLRLATTLWKRDERGGLHQLTPFVQVRGDVASDTEGGTPVRFDGVEDPRDGRFIDLGLRGRFDVLPGRATFDASLRATHAASVTGQIDAWLPAAVFARLSTTAFGRPTAIWHDARYGLSDGTTRYSLTAIGYQFSEKLELEAGHRRGVDEFRRGLFDAATLAALYRWTDKWEFEASQTIDLLRDDSSLESRVLVRRYGHDLIFELDTSFRAGEGGSSFGIGVRPRIGFDRPVRGVLGY